MKDLFANVKILPAPHMVEKKVVRVRGGYLNRWLIRAEVIAPSNRIVFDEVTGVGYCHPEVLDKLQKAVRARVETLTRQEARREPWTQHRRAWEGRI
jgi:hypothetical protein